MQNKFIIILLTIYIIKVKTDMKRLKDKNLDENDKAQGWKGNVVWKSKNEVKECKQKVKVVRV
jgi:hypothetical protein